MKFIVNINEITGSTKKKVGNKALRLSELFMTGFNVPKAFIITVDVFENFILENGLNNFMNYLLIEKSQRKICKISRKIRIGIVNGKMKGDIEKEILSKYENLNAKFVAVRSSAICEDSNKASFAGQFETFLSVKKNNLIQRVKDVWASMFTENIITYTLLNKISFCNLKMGVIVMRMVNAIKAGVIFTKDTLTRDEDKIIIEGAAGLGDKVVKGIIEPDCIIVDKKSGKIERKSRINVLSKTEIERLARVAMRVEKFFGMAQDIEWAIDKENIWILQARPITI